MTPKAVFVVRNCNGLYWQDHPMIAWGFLSARWTKSWKTRRGAERFLEKNPGVGRNSRVESVSENEPRSGWR